MLIFGLQKSFLLNFEEEFEKLNLNKTILNAKRLTNNKNN